VSDVVSTGGIRFGSVEMERQQCANRRIRCVRRVRLQERPAVIGEPAHSAVASEIVVEGTVFLNENDHFFYISHFAATYMSFEQLPKDAGQEGGASTAAAAPAFNSSRRVTVRRSMRGCSL